MNNDDKAIALRRMRALGKSSEPDGYLVHFAGIINYGLSDNVPAGIVTIKSLNGEYDRIRSEWETNYGDEPRITGWLKPDGTLKMSKDGSLYNVQDLSQIIKDNTIYD